MTSPYGALSDELEGRPYVKRNQPGHYDSGGEVVVPFANDDQMTAILAALRLRNEPELPDGDDTDAVLAAACRKYNIGSVRRLDDTLASLRSLQTGAK